METENTPTAPPTGPAGQRIPVNIEDELRASYLDYAMSVIIGRAIPDVRDGLKPVHRRILYAMLREGLTAGARYSKCAGIVGEVLKKYHPHGDSAVYDALARLAQPWNMRRPLVDGQGNFGSVDGDPPAAYRYTEARMTRLAEELLADIDKDTVDFGPTYDDSHVEPLVLPSRFPNLLVNGTDGIAVGMATKIPPHNLREILDATILLVRTPETTLIELMDIVQGPDFPTGGSILGRSGIAQAYATGRGRIQVRAKATVEPEGRGDREMIVITEIPYQVNKAELVAKIAELVRDKRIEGISGMPRDESDRDGMRIVIELKRDANAQVLLNQLYKMTAMQTTFGIINLMIVGGRPQILGLKEVLEQFIEHRREVVLRRTRFELREAEARREIVEGLGMALTEIDAVIHTIRTSPDTDVARERLMRLPLRGLEEFVRRAGRPEDEILEAAARGEYFLSERQANAILDMRLSRLTGLEQEKLAAEYAALCDTIASLQAILASEEKLKDVIVAELEDIRERFGDDRRTEISAEEGDLEIEDLIAEEDMIVTCSHEGYIKRTPVTEYRAQRRGGRGKAGMETREEDWVNQIFVASTHSYVLFFSDKGKAYLKKVFEIPAASRISRGRAIVNFVGTEPGEKVAAILPVREFSEGRYVMTATRRGSVKKTDLMAYSNIRQTGIIGVGIDEGDELIAALVTDGTRDVLIGTRKGMALRFSEEEVRAMGRGASGVRGIELREGDEVVGMSVVEEGRTGVLTVCQNGYGKRTDLEEYRVQHRGGIGLISIQASERNGDCVALRLVAATDDLLFVTDRGTLLRTKVAEISSIGRNTQGVRLVKTEETESVVGVEVVEETVEPEEPETLVLDGSGGHDEGDGEPGSPEEDEGGGDSSDEGSGPEGAPTE